MLGTLRPLDAIRTPLGKMAEIESMTRMGTFISNQLCPRTKTVEGTENDLEISRRRHRCSRGT
jgi:hypothetical protein